MPAYDWSQTNSEVTVQYPVEAAVGRDQIRCKIEATHLSVRVSGSNIFDQELGGKIVVDESFWALEGSGEARVLIITLCKKKDASNWRGLTKEDEAELAPTDIMADNFDVMALEHDEDDPERVEEQEENEKKLEARYQKLLTEKGLQDESTLETFFALFDNCIQLYRLNKLHKYLQDVVPECRKRNDKFKLKAIQALAFVLWKQSKFREAIPLFHEMEDILGKGAALCENIAHTYNSLGEYDKAEDYFRQALKFIEQEHGFNAGNRGGVLLGLGLVRDRLGRPREALPVIQQAYNFYKDRANGSPASLQAKAGISCAKIHAKLGELSKAEGYIREAVQMYEVTCGDTSPLTASGYHELGKCLWAQRKREDAQKALARAYELEAMKDAWDLVTILEIHNALMDAHLKETANIERSAFKEYFRTVDFVTNRVRKNMAQDGNAAVYFKAAAEMKAWGGKYEEARDLFNEAIPIFRLEKTTDCTGLIKACEDMLAFCQRNIEGTQQSPMNFDIPEMEQTTSGESTSGPVIEEVDCEDVVMSEVCYNATDPSSASADAITPECEYKLADEGDFTQAMKLCLNSKRRPLLADETSFSRHLKGAGAGFCWVAALGESLVGMAICGSDGIFLNVLQLVVAPELSKNAQDGIAHEILEKCTLSCNTAGLRCIQADIAAGGERGGEIFEGKGWQANHFVYRSSGMIIDDGDCCQDWTAKSVGAAAVSSSAAAGSSTDGKPFTRIETTTPAEYYKSWDKVGTGDDVGGGPATGARVLADFGEEAQDLDPSRKIGRYSWDQGKLNVSIYIPFDGVGNFPENAISCVFRPRGVLLVIIKDGQRHWYKMPNLCKEIDVNASVKKVKADQVVLKLRKVAQGQTWSDLHDEKDKYQQTREQRLKSGDLKGATTEQLLADMYNNANDEERAGLRDAMRVNQQKRQEEANKANNIS